MAEQAVNVIYKLAENPDVICEEILKEITNIVMTHVVESNSPKRSRTEKSTENESEKEVDKENVETQEKESTEGGNMESSQPEPSQSQGFSFSGLCIYVYLEQWLVFSFIILFS